MAPDDFTGSLTASQAAEAIAAGWRRSAPLDELVLRPISDGGPGFLNAVAAANGGRFEEVATTGPHGEHITAQVLLVEEAGRLTGYVESAQTVGRAATSTIDQPLTATSSGLAAPVRAAMEAGVDRLVVGLGGTLTTDGGAGLLAGLGATATDRAGRDGTELLRAGGAALSEISSVDLSAARQMLAGKDLIAAVDVENPLLGERGAARGFAPQKGASAQQVELLEAGLAALAQACGTTPEGRRPALTLGAGAAGGLGFAFRHLGAGLTSGIDLVLAALRFDQVVADSDLVITGEGKFDWQSMRGKAITGVCRVAMNRGRPVLVLAGELAVGRREWMSIGVSGAYGIIDEADPERAARATTVAMAQAGPWLCELAQRAARTWSPQRG